MFTKSLFLAASLIGTATLASADTSFFTYQYNLDNRPILDLSTVTSSGSGVVEIYDDNGGQLGRLLGSEAVMAGANANVRVNVNAPPNFDVIAVLRVDGAIVATRNYRID